MMIAVIVVARPAADDSKLFQDPGTISSPGGSAISSLDAAGSAAGADDKTAVDARFWHGHHHHGHGGYGMYNKCSDYIL